MSIKDLEATKGIRSTMGSLIFHDTVPDINSVVAERVRDSGAVLLGKTNTPKFGLQGITENRLGDACRNPWNTERTSGGSSGGAGAAVAAGLCAIATGTDGGGSIRNPSSFCGLYGIKPTTGRVPRAGGLVESAGQGKCSRPRRYRRLFHWQQINQIRKPERPGNEIAGLVSDYVERETGCKHLDYPDFLP